jgi:hypothetical protein
MVSLSSSQKLKWKGEWTDNEVLFQETFTDVDNTLINTHDSNWTSVPELFISNNTLINDGSGNSGIISVYNLFPIGNGSMSFDCSSSAGFYFHHVDTDNYYYNSFDSSGGTLRKRVGGVDADLFPYTTDASGVHNYRLSYVDGLIKLYIDDVEVSSVNDTTFPTGYCGLYPYIGNYIDNFTIGKFFSYNIDNLVKHNQGLYVCIQNHIASMDAEPGVGINWQTTWDLIAQGV